MGQAARVTSIDAVREMAAAIASFRGEASAALDELDMEIRRALEWILHDRKEYWADEVRRGGQRVTEARIQLQQAQMSRRIADHEPSCFDEKKLLERSKRRLEVALAKVEVVRHWAGVIEHAVNEYRASRGQLTGWLDADVPRGLAALARITEALESYVAVSVPGGSSPMGAEDGGTALEIDAGAASPSAETVMPPDTAGPPEHPEEFAP